MYYGHRTNNGVEVEVIADVKNGREVFDMHGLKSYKLKHAVRHSPDGFEFGFMGSGPSDLARSILLDLKDDLAKVEVWYQDFKVEFIAPLEGEEFIIAEDAINFWWESKENNGSI